MARLMLCLLLLSPLEAREPSIDDLLHVYRNAGWVQTAGHTCIANAQSVHVDRVVWMISQRAKGARCS